MYLTFSLPGVCELLQSLPAFFDPGGDGDGSQMGAQKGKLTALWKG